MLTNKARKQILESFLETIKGVFDKNYQKRVWIRDEGPECDDFDETSCHLSEMGDSILGDYKDFDFTED